MPPLFALRAFSAAARWNSFAKAGAELNLTPAAVAYQVKKLEQHLGIALFERSARGVALNAAGEAYARIAGEALDGLAQQTDLFKAQFEAQPLRIGALHFVSERLVLPMVQTFLDDHPGVVTELISDNAQMDLRAGNLDIVVAHGTQPPEDCLSIKILSETLVPVCAPSVLEGFPGGMKLEDLSTIPALFDLFWDKDWSIWLDHVGGPSLEKSLGFSLYSTMVKTLIDGGGIAIGHLGLLQSELASGALVKAFPQEIPSPNSYFAMTAEENLAKPRVATFWQWLQDRSAKQAAA